MSKIKTYAVNGPIDAETVIQRLEGAGRTLMALPAGGYSTKLRTFTLDIVRSAMEGYGLDQARARPAVPSASSITDMDIALTWVGLIPQDRYVLRRVVGARSLVNPLTDRHIFPWRRLGAALGADHKAVQRWHAQGIDIIVAALNGQSMSSDRVGRRQVGRPDLDQPSAVW